jgi:hypothetical protein
MADAMRRPFEVIYPELHAFPAADRRDALQQVRRGPLEFLELTGIAMGLVVVTALTRYSDGELGVVDRANSVLANFAVAVPRLLLAVTPLLVRRTRCGLHAGMQRHGLRSGK